MKTKLFVSIFCITWIFIGCGNNKTVKFEVSTDSTTKSTTMDYKMMIIAKIFVKPDKAKEFIAAAKEMIEKSNKESGCKSYQLYQDPYDNTKLVFVEEYENQAAVDAHFGTDYFKAFGPKIKELVAEPAEIKIVSVAKEEVK